MSVSAIIVTRGDVDLDPILESLPEEWEVIVWDNGHGIVSKRVLKRLLARIVTGKGELPDLSVYGRYAAIEYATGDLIYVQDDDCIVSDPLKLISYWIGSASLAGPAPADGSDLENVWTRDHVVSNMPLEFRQDFYREHALVGFGAVFHRDAPSRAFERFYNWHRFEEAVDSIEEREVEVLPEGALLRTCDVVFTALTPRVLVDVEYSNLPWASAPNRMWKQPDHRKERGDMLDLVLKVRDGD